MNTERFVELAHAVHGDLFDYSDTHVVNRKTKVKIKCKIHGAFEMTPDNHLRGQGCPHNECRSKKRVVTNQTRYGVDNVMQSQEIRDRYTNAFEQKHGVRNPMQVPEIRARQNETMKATMMESYGVEYPGQSAEIRARAENTMIRTFGVSNVMKLKEYQDKMMAKKVVNGTLKGSGPEDRFYPILCDIFGDDDVIRQYHSSKPPLRNSDVYPYHADFFIVSRSLWIEINAHQTHGTHFFDGSSSDDLQRFSYLRAKAKSSDMYAREVYVWTELDVRKRDCARKNKLNYVVFWDTDLRDAILWVAMGCPDGRDWEHEYSWINERDISDVSFDGVFKSDYQTLSRIAKCYQLPVFYRREIDMWNRNGQRNDISFQIWLYYNRYMYSESRNKLPNDISNMALLRGFKQSGVLQSYSVFDTRLMDRVIKKYGFQSIYDPCAGWGERMLYCKAHGMKYFGVDVNLGLKRGYHDMMFDLDITDQDVMFADSSKVKLYGQYDCVMTCPPYFNQEIYSKDGAENLKEPEFLAWWKAVVENSLQVDPGYFCVQLNQKCLVKMMPVIESCGFEIVDRFDAKVQASHMNKKNVKREFESMVVLKRK